MADRDILFDDLVGAGEDCGRNIQPERLGGLEVEHQLEFGRLLRWQIGRRGALRISSVNTDLVIDRRETYPIAHRAAGHSEFTPCIDRRDGTVQCQGCEFIDSGDEERIAGDHEGADMLVVEV